MTCAPRPSPALVEALNAARAAHGLGALRVHPALEAAASAHAADLLSNGAFDHAGSDGSLPLARVQRAGLNPRMAAENLSMGRTEAAAVVEGWQSSEGHRANTLSEATLIGTAWARYGRLGLVSDELELWVAVFAAEV